MKPEARREECARRCDAKGADGDAQVAASPVDAEEQKPLRHRRAQGTPPAPQPLPRRSEDPAHKSRRARSGTPNARFPSNGQYDSDAVRAGIDTLVVNGNTSEFFSLAMGVSYAAAARPADRARSRSGSRMGVRTCRALGRSHVRGRRARFYLGIINVHSLHAKRIHRALEQGDYAESMRLVAQMATFEKLRAEDRNGANVSVVKAALQLIRRD